MPNSTTGWLQNNHRPFAPGTGSAGFQPARVRFNSRLEAGAPGSSATGASHFIAKLKSPSLNPKGILACSPGLRGTSYPGLSAEAKHNPNGVAAAVNSAVGPQPRWGWMQRRGFPKVTRASQPWVEGHNPFGIGGLWLCNKVRCAPSNRRPISAIAIPPR